jgi:uncharacterized cupredoxin-like copper-binding protein
LPAVAVLASTDLNAFHVVGGLLALWAVVLFVLGVTRHGFPAKAGAERAVMAISAVLVAGAIGTAIATSGEEKPKGSETRNAPNKGGREGSSAPNQGATPAPESDRESGQGSSSENAKKPAAAQAAQTLTLSADPGGQLAFDKKALQAKAGTVRLVANNPSPLQHNISLQGAGVNKQGPTVGKGGASQITVPVKAGKYTFYCSVPGHREAGMQGTLTVK